MKKGTVQTLGLAAIALCGAAFVGGNILIDSLPKSLDTIKEFNYQGRKANIMKEITTKLPKWDPRYFVQIGEDRFYIGDFTSDKGNKISIPWYGTPTINGESIK